jgi:hypothetical protein
MSWINQPVNIETALIMPPTVSAPATPKPVGAIHKIAALAKANSAAISNFESCAMMFSFIF